MGSCRNILFLLILASTTLGCVSDSQQQNLPDLKVLKSKPGAKDLKKYPETLVQFRTLFKQIDQGHSSRDLYESLLLPSSALFAPPQSSIDGVVNHFKEFSPEQAYINSLVTGFPKSKNSISPTKIKDPITLVVVPGAFSELATGMVFPEAVDQQNSAYARFVNKQFARASSDLKRDQHYSLKHRGPIEAPLKELVRYGSIDYAAGNPLINVVFLFPKFGSLESFGNIEDHYSYYKRRLDKFFAIIGTPKKIYLSGHSRGGPIGLHLLSRLQDDPEAKGWSKRIRGFVAFNGALFGSSFTNAYFDPTLPANQIRKQVLALAKLEAKNEVLVSVRNRLQILDNSIPLAAGLVFSKAYEKEDFGISLPDIFTGARIAEDFRKQVGGDRVLGDYAGHIARLKIMATAIDECMRSLTYKVRTKWWETHTLPTNIKYYSFSATMPSPLMKSKPTKWQKSFMKSKMLDGDTVDYKILRGLYYDFYSDRHVSLSDGLIGVHESTFWPKLHQSLNPKQKLYESEILGLFGIHHFALTYARTASDDVDSKHPFPRATFLKTLAQYLEAVDSEK